MTNNQLKKLLAGNNRLNIYQISALHEMLSEEFSDPYIEVPAVNGVLEILGYRGHFVFDEDTGKIRWCKLSAQEAEEAERDKKDRELCDVFSEEGRDDK